MNSTREKGDAKTDLAANLRIWSARFLYAFLVALLIGGTTTRILGFSGQGLTPGVLIVLIPIWMVGGVGALLAIVAWGLHPDHDGHLEFTFTESSTEMFSPGMGYVIRGLGGLLALLMVIAFAGLVADENQNLSVAKRWGLGYVFESYALFLVYLSWFYRSRTHRVTTTYLNTLSPLFGFLLIPLGGPLLVVFSTGLHRPADLRNTPEKDMVNREGADHIHT
ncbi:MAG: hypothetical protein KDA80_02490 [Planctomycetaceae bacterium]|nr:hypothetical protein [Planctomycetaceae bacterium]